MSHAAPGGREGSIRGGGAERVPPTVLMQGIGATPIDHFVLWTGGVYDAKAGSRCSRALSLITEVWTPVPLRELLIRAAKIEGEAGFPPDAVREAVRQQQRVNGACYLWVRRIASGDYVAICDIPSPAHQVEPIRRADMVLGRIERPMSSDNSHGLRRFGS